MKTPNDYQRDTIETAIYPESGQQTGIARAYCALGLVNEAHEFLEKVDLGEKASFGPDDEDAVMDLVHEAGDVLWYQARLLSELGIAFDRVFEVMGDNEANIGYYIDPLQDSPPAIAGIVKKIIRDGKREDGSDVMLILERLRAYNETMLVTVGSILKRTVRDALVIILEENLAKLRSRKERGVIGGSGDNR